MAYDTKISIHTPAKGVTNSETELWPGAYISIHTPAKGVTWNSGEAMLQRDYFNPHSREGSDVLDDDMIAGDGISIHTPAKGVTGYAVTIEVYTDQFQSTLPRRE